MSAHFTSDQAKSSSPPAHSSAGAYGRYRLFVILYVIYGLTHFSYYFYYQWETTILTYLWLGLVLLLAWRPLSVPCLLGAQIFFLLDSWILMPVGSNHLMINLFFSAAILLAALWGRLFARGCSFDHQAFYTVFAVTGRWLLLIMYFFGVFHKINSGFLTPEHSCAAALMAHFTIIPAVWAAHPLIAYPAIYGTFIIETVIVFCLLSKQFRFHGIVLGMAFHYVLGLNGYAYYVAFSALSVMLHVLFVDEALYHKIRASVIQRPILFTGLASLSLLLYCAGLGLMIAVPDTSWLIKIFWAYTGGLILCLTTFHYRSTAATAPGMALIKTVNPAALILVALFFLNGLAPYYGLKDGQAIAMFSNLDVQNGRSNHLLVPKSWTFLTHLDEIVTIRSIGPEPVPQAVGQEQPLILLKNYIARNPDRIVTYEQNGRISQLSLDQAADPKSWKMPLWQEKFLVFRVNHKEAPGTCSFPP